MASTARSVRFTLDKICRVVEGAGNGQRARGPVAGAHLTANDDQGRGGGRGPRLGGTDGRQHGFGRVRGVQPLYVVCRVRGTDVLLGERHTVPLLPARQRDLLLRGTAGVWRSWRRARVFDRCRLRGGRRGLALHLVLLRRHRQRRRDLRCTVWQPGGQARRAWHPHAGRLTPHRSKSETGASSEAPVSARPNGVVQ